MSELAMASAVNKNVTALERPQGEAVSPGVLARLEGVCETRGLPALAARLRMLGAGVAADLAACEAALARVPRGQGVVERSATHLLDLGGKRLRPLCVILAARVGDGFSAAARELAVAVELVHAATLLHDDVVDLGDVRRSVATARTLYGNAASIFAGDWLLVEALRRVRVARVDGTLDRLLAVIEEMIFAESVQLERRGRIVADRAVWLRVAEGKTAALFRWAMFAGARAGGLSDGAAAALERYGMHLGVAFQAIDDLLDLAGDPQLTGKSLLADLREGKVTYPLAIALERDPELAPVIAGVVSGEAAPSAGELAQVLASVRASGGLEETRALARARALEAAACLSVLPDGPAKHDLITVAEATVNRDA